MFFPDVNLTKVYVPIFLCLSFSGGYLPAFCHSFRGKYTGCHISLTTSLHLALQSNGTIVIINLKTTNNISWRITPCSDHFPIKITAEKLPLKTTLFTRHAISILICAACMLCATLASFLYQHIVPDNHANVALFYILALVIIARWTVATAAALPAPFFRNSDQLSVHLSVL